jgi:hypothetical protein
MGTNVAGRRSAVRVAASLWSMSAALREALRLQPDGANMHCNLVLTLHYQPGYDATTIYEECRR